MTETVEMNMELIEFNNNRSNYTFRRCGVEDLVGKVIRGIAYNYDYFQLLTDDYTYIFYHEQDCCESVNLTQVDGNLDKIIGSRIVIADVSTNHSGEVGYDSETWSFYKIGTNKGMIDFRWQGCSNGYYSEEVDLIKIKRDENNG